MLLQHGPGLGIEQRVAKGVLIPVAERQGVGWGGVGLAARRLDRHAGCAGRRVDLVAAPVGLCVAFERAEPAVAPGFIGFEGVAEHWDRAELDQEVDVRAYPQIAIATLDIHRMGADHLAVPPDIEGDPPL